MFSIFFVIYAFISASGVNGFLSRVCAQTPQIREFSKDRALDRERALNMVSLLSTFDPMLGLYRLLKAYVSLLLLYSLHLYLHCRMDARFGA